ncbi:MAG: YbjN domain-containing protein [Leptonema sp. (in: bacteria)]
MTDKNQVYKMIDKLMEEFGLGKKDVYDEEYKTYRWRRGSASIEVFVQDVPVSSGTRTFLRVFSYLGKVPRFKDLELYKKLLEMNDSYLGVKLTLMPDSNQIYATYERDINGIEYEELKTCINDLEYWADLLDDELNKQFGVEK